jgi:hypothetical protein
VNVELRVRNHLFKPAQVRIQLKLPQGVSCANAERTVMVPAKSGVAVPFELRTTTPGRKVVTADVTINGKRIGEYAEALIDSEE